MCIGDEIHHCDPMLFLKLKRMRTKLNRRDDFAMPLVYGGLDTHTRHGWDRENWDTCAPR